MAEKNGKPDREQPFVVSFEREDDPNDPHNWRLYYRALCTAYLSFMAAAVEFVSVADSLGIEEAAAGGKINKEVKFLMTGGYLIGLGFGCLFSAPFSEAFGRNPVYIFSPTGLCFMLIIQHFQHARGCKAIIRTIGAFLGSDTTVSSAGATSDIWTRLDRSYIFAIYICIVFAGPLLASIIGPIIITTYKITIFPAQMIFTSLAWGVAVFLMPETYAPVILFWKAKILRKLTGQSRFKAPMKLKRVAFRRGMKHALSRPFRFLYKDTMLALVVAYTGLNSIITYQMFSAVPLLFVTEYGFSLYHEGLAFIPAIGGIFLCAPAVVFNYRILKKRLIMPLEKGYTGVEIGLFLAMAGAPAIPISLFWMAWTGRPSMSFWAPVMSTTLYSYGVVCVTISVFQYATDSFESYAASAQASVLMVRYVVAGAMAEVAIPIHQHLQIRGDLSLFGGLSVLMVPVPFLLYRYAYKIQKSKYRSQTRITQD
ncbi:Major facilitator superfamily domain, general substrate transporter [Penicillium occitanis (nom. inval.)]|nr:Major facilitator superfamily domain, general substrate transporter [Penicillium occitanis (nom. inval.)]PCH07881.1 hypothetical protein PENOC_017210 [Penicillium occitanis (nom. inval.)]